MVALNNANITQMPAVKVAEDQSKLADFQNSDFKIGRASCRERV